MAEGRDRVIAFVEARMGSSRLPGKSMAEIRGTPSLVRIVERLRRARSVDGVGVATTSDPSDDPIAEAAERSGALLHRGETDDVLARVLGAARVFGADAVCEITGDCPLIDPEIVDLVVSAFREGGFDYVGNVDPVTYPPGVDVRVIATSALARLHETLPPADPWREHVSAYMPEHRDAFRCRNLPAPPDRTDPRLRLMVDYPEDLALVRALHDALEPIHGPAFGLGAVLDLLHRRPDLRDLNRRRETPA